MSSLIIRRGFAVALICLALMPAGACAPSARISYIPDGGTYAAGDLPGILETADAGELSEIPVDGIAEARQEALADLRAQGDEAAALADTLTHQFPVDVNSVPVEVHRATYEGEPAWVVVESWGDTGQPLSSLRLWVFSTETLELITALSAQ